MTPESMLQRENAEMRALMKAVLQEMYAKLDGYPFPIKYAAPWQGLTAIAEWLISHPSKENG